MMLAQLGSLLGEHKSLGGWLCEQVCYKGKNAVVYALLPAKSHVPTLPRAVVLEGVVSI